MSLISAYNFLRDELNGIAKDWSEKEDREVTTSEVLPRMTLELANTRRRALGKPLLKHDVSSKPGGTPIMRRAVGVTG